MLVRGLLCIWQNMVDNPQIKGEGKRKRARSSQLDSVGLFY